MTTSTLQKIKPVPLRLQVASSIREAILRGDLEPGQRLVERKLAAELGVSQVALREALPELEHEGLLTRVPNVGTHVTQLSPAKIRELVDVRLQLEPHAMVLASRRLNPRAIHELQSLVDQYNRFTGAGDVYKSVRTDFAFHRCIWDLAGNETLARILAQVCTPTFAFLMILLGSTRADLREQVDVHQLLLDAIVERNPENIRRKATELIEESWRPHVTEPD
jgi:DNA-binding GntR family transcriptional regulator